MRTIVVLLLLTSTALAQRTITPTPLPPPPPSSVTLPSTMQGVPPTPVPSFPGAPAPISSGAVAPSAQGLPSDVQSELRPSLAPNNQQVANVQARLAAGGYYRGPIDGQLDAQTRAAVLKFQATARLPETGLLDSETVARLNGNSNSVPANVGNNPTTGTNGTTATAGTPVSPFFPVAPGLESGSTATSNTPFPLSNGTSAGTPFPLSSPLNMSANPPPGTTAQP